MQLKNSFFTRCLRTSLLMSQNRASKQSLRLRKYSLTDTDKFIRGATCADTSKQPITKNYTQNFKTNIGHTLQNAPLNYHMPTGPLQLLSRPYSKFTSAQQNTSVLISQQALTEENAHDLIANLKDSERNIIKSALAQYDSLKIKENLQGRLAANQWRTRFGRFSKVPTLGEVDPTGSFCAFPEDWLKKKAAEKAVPPCRSDLMKIFSVNAAPFLVFGFLDNFVMIVAGDYIEVMLGSLMYISTLAAAGLGNTLSDILGIGSAYYVERGCQVLGLRPPDLTPVQLEMKSSQRSANWGRILGITLGCLLGMTPLLFLSKKDDQEKITEEAEV